MATTKKAEMELAIPQKKASDDRVSVFIPRGDPNGEPMFYVSVNDYSANLPRGKSSLVPAYIAAEIERHFAEEDKLYSEIANREITPENSRFM